MVPAFIPIERLMALHVPKKDIWVSSTWITDVKGQYYWNRALSNEEIISMIDNPFQILLPSGESDLWHIRNTTSNN